MGKAIMISIKPKWVAKILNGEKTIEIRKRFPKNYVGWVYIYCAKGNYMGKFGDGLYHEITNGSRWSNGCSWNMPKIYLQGKVVARFWCNKVEEVIYDNIPFSQNYFTPSITNPNKFLEKASLEWYDLYKYLGENNGYAWHIDNLEIFDKPKELGEFSSKIEKTCICFNQFVAEGTQKIPLTRAPQSWCYIEVEHGN